MKNFLFALSIDVISKPYIDFPRNITVTHQGRKVGGSGIGWYPGDDNAAIVIKDPKSFADLGRPQIIDDKTTFNSTTFVMHLNGASWNPIPQDTEPYSKTVGKRDWLWMHQGTLDLQKLRKKNSQFHENFYEPVGNTDSELAFCIILNRIMRLKVKKLAEVGWDRLHDWFKELNELGSANFFLSDGKNMVVYRGLDGANALYKERIKPPYEKIELNCADAGFVLNFNKEDDNLRTVCIFSTLPVTTDGINKEMKKGQMVVAKNGTIKWNSHVEPKKIEINTGSFNNAVNAAVNPPPPPPSKKKPYEPLLVSDFTKKSFYVNTINIKDTRLIKVSHDSFYTYSEAVEKSEHVFRLMPMHNRFQQPLEYGLEMSVEGDQIFYRDVFNNDVVHLLVNTPYTEFKLRSQAIVRIHKMDADDFSHALRKSTIPATWMPWQRQMVQAYLLPQELPETQLRELSEYAMSFAERNDYNLFDTFVDINRTIYEDYEYKSGSTDINTTAFEVYTSRKGVCQDFANLLICMARLLNVPARYRVGYIYTGANYENKEQGDATHAWAELYIPYVGWRGFDPTNGKMVDLDYVRVACGRNFMDATPTAGTIYKGGGTEKLIVNVRTEILEDFK